MPRAVPFFLMVGTVRTETGLTIELSVKELKRNPTILPEPHT